MNIYKLAVSIPVLALAACAQQPLQPEAQPAQPGAFAPAPKPRVVVRPAAKPPVLPKQELSQAVLFKMLLAEIALQRGQNNVAVQSYLELTRETKDPRIAQRATEVAWNSRFLGAALETAGIWLAADPESQQARQILAALLVNQARLADAQPHLEKSLAADKENVGNSFPAVEYAARAPSGQGGGVAVDAESGRALSGGAGSALQHRPGGVERGPGAARAQRNPRGA